MAIIRVTNRNYGKKMATVTAGDVVLLAPGNYYEPMVLNGITGTAERPVVIKAESEMAGQFAIFKSEISEDEARKRANRVAAHRENSGYYPTVGHLGEQALLILKECQFVIIDGLHFDGCWPSAIFIDNSMYVAVNHCDFRRGTIAIVAQGSNCHDVVIQHCSWKQDTSEQHIMWNTVLWDRIHGAANNSKLGGVDTQYDYRHWDGDFFRGWNIQGNFVFRDNHIEDAFNGIHFFNSRDLLAPGVEANSMKFNRGRQSTVNILIENNTFIRIRDNIFEPEDHAWNWVIRHNRVYDCYRPFSFEFERAGWFYVYGNTGAFVNRPTTGTLAQQDQHIKPTKRRQTPSLYKCKGVQANEGPIYVFNNSWFFGVGKGVFPKGQLGHLVHMNNAVQFLQPDDAVLFGRHGTKPSSVPYNLQHELVSENKRFTRRWDHYGIQMDGDISNDISFPDHYRTLGYTIGANALNGNPAFAKIGESAEDPFDFTPQFGPAIGSAAGFNLVLPNPHSAPVNIAPGGNIGAVQQPGYYNTLDRQFTFLPALEWLPQLSEPSAPSQV